MDEQRVPSPEAGASPPRRSLDRDAIDIGDLIGRGGQATVYEATIPDDDPPDRVALKEPLQPGTLTAAAADRFLDRARRWQTVDDRERDKPRWSDDAVVGVVDVGDSFPWIAMEYMDAGGLDDRLDGGGLPLAEALWIGERLCHGVEVAHSYGIAHLDLKPANVLFQSTPDGQWDLPKIADWGLARALAEQTGSMEARSPQYSAPEQFDPEAFGDPDTLTDVYQAGAVVYEALTGDPPYTGSQFAVVGDITDDTPPDPPSTRADGIPPVVDAAVGVALEPEKTDRYDGIQNLRTALRAARTGRRPPIAVADRLDADSALDRTSSPASDFDDPGRSTPDEAPQSREDETTAADDAGSSPVDDDEGSDTEEDPALLSDEERVERLLSRNGGRIRQADVVDETRWSERKVSRLLSEMADDGRIETLRIGRETLVQLHDDEDSPSSGRSDSRTGTAEDAARGVAADRWTTPHANVARTGDATDRSGPTDGVDERWSFPASESARIRVSPVVGADRVYVAEGSYDEAACYGLDRETGSVEWSRSLGHRAEASPTLRNGTVYLGDERGTVWALDAATGEVEWRFEAPDRINGAAPAVVDGTVYVVSGHAHEESGRLHSLDVTDGTEAWSTPLPNPAEAAPAVADSTVYVPCYGGTLCAVAADGSGVEWRFDADDRTSPMAPAVADGVVYHDSRDDSGDSQLFALDAATGRHRWTTDRHLAGSPTIVDGTLFASGAYTSDGYVAADPADGSVRWESAPGPGFFSVRSADALYTGGRDGLYCLDPADGDTLWSFRTGESVTQPPAVLDDELYAVVGNTLRAFEAQ